MSKKDFVLLAKHVSQIRDMDSRVQAAIAVALACKESNPRFNAEKFIAACSI